MLEEGASRRSGSRRTVPGWPWCRETAGGRPRSVWPGSSGRTSPSPSDGWRPIDLTQTDAARGQPDRRRGLARRQRSAAAGRGVRGEQRVAPVRVAADASRVTAEGGEPATWEARQLTVLGQPQTAVVVGRRTRLAGHRQRMAAVARGLTAVAYPADSAVTDVALSTDLVGRPRHRGARRPDSSGDLVADGLPVGSPRPVTCCWAPAVTAAAAAWWGVCVDCRAELAARHPRWTRPDPCPAGFPGHGHLVDVRPAAARPGQRPQGAPGARADPGARPTAGGRACTVLLRARGVAPGTAVSLVPVPSAARAVRERGFDATAAMARTAARCAPAGLPGRRSRRSWSRSAGVRDQSGLDARARQANLAGGFRLRGRLPDRPGRAGRRPGDHRQQPGRGGPGAASGRCSGPRGGHGGGDQRRGGWSPGRPR